MEGSITRVQSQRLAQVLELLERSAYWQQCSVKLVPGIYCRLSFELLAVTGLNRLSAGLRIPLFRLLP